MKMNEMKESKYLKKEDVGEDGMIVTIAHLERENLAMPDQDPDEKWILYFKEDVKPMVLNWTNTQLIFKVTNTDDTDDWEGHEIILFEDPTIRFKDQLVGGIRVRGVKAKSAGPKAAPQRSKGKSEDPDDDIPF